MRHVFTIVLLLAVLNVFCTRSGVPLQSGGSLSAVERQNIIAMHPDLERWNPSQSALWVRHGITRHVCIQQGSFGGLTMPYEVFVFDGDGGVVEANLIEAPHPSTPMTVSSVSPLRVAYKSDGNSVVCSGEYAEATWHQDIQKRMHLQHRLREIFESWGRSGSTNYDVLRQEIRGAITDSNK
jgi:hypothetical protein